MADSEKVPEQQQLKQKQHQVNNHLDGINGDGTIQSSASDAPPQPKQIIGMSTVSFIHCINLSYMLSVLNTKHDCECVLS